MSVRVGDGENGLGCSGYTLDVKLQQFPRVLGKFLAIYRNLLRQGSARGGEIVVLDLTAGAGSYQYHDRTARGMVLQSLDALRELGGLGVPWRICAIEQKRAHYAALGAAVDQPYGTDPRGTEQVLLLHGDNARLAPAFLDALDNRYRCLLIVYDWNGVADLDLVTSLMGHPRARYADAIGHIQAVALKRWRSYYGGAPIPPPTDRRKLHERLAAIPRRRLLLRRLYGNPQWTYAISTNAPDVGSFIALEFAERGTPAGDWLLEALSFDDEELAGGEGLAGSGRPRQIGLPW